MTELGRASQRGRNDRLDCMGAIDDAKSAEEYAGSRLKDAFEK